MYSDTNLKDIPQAEDREQGTVSKTSLNIPEDLWTEVRVAAARQRTTATAILIESLQAYLDGRIMPPLEGSITPEAVDLARRVLRAAEAAAKGKA